MVIYDAINIQMFPFNIKNICRNEKWKTLNAVIISAMLSVFSIALSSAMYIGIVLSVICSPCLIIIYLAFRRRRRTEEEFQALAEMPEIPNQV